MNFHICDEAGDMLAHYRHRFLNMMSYVCKPKSIMRDRLLAGSLVLRLTSERDSVDDPMEQELAFLTGGCNRFS